MTFLVFGDKNLVFFYIKKDVFFQNGKKKVKKTCENFFIFNPTLAFFSSHKHFPTFNLTLDVLFFVSSRAYLFTFNLVHLCSIQLTVSFFFHHHNQTVFFLAKQNTPSTGFFFYNINSFSYSLSWIFTTSFSILYSLHLQSLPNICFITSHPYDKTLNFCSFFKLQPINNQI